MLSGIDVSHHQGDIDWVAVGNSGIDFAIVRSSFGSFAVDRKYEVNKRLAARCLRFSGVYHFCVPANDPAIEAKAYTELVGDLNADVIGPVVDLEWWQHGEPKAADKPSGDDVAHLGNWLAEFLSVCERAWPSRKPLIYTSPAFWARYMGNTKSFDAYPCWVAQWGSKMSRPLPNVILWQHDNKGRVTGITGDVDLNRYFGSIYDLVDLTPKCVPDP